MATSVAYKLNHTTRIYGQASNDAGGIPITTCTIEVKLIAGNNIVTKSLGSGVGFGPSDGSFWYEIAQLDIVALGNPGQITTTFNIWNADNSLLLTSTGVMAVEN